MSEPADVKRLLARGFTVELADGASHEIRFTSRSLARIEDDYGGLQEFTEALQRKSFNTMAYVIHLTLGVPQDDALDLVDSRKSKAYVNAIADAIAEALGDQDVVVRILQNHEIQGDRYRAGQEVTVPSPRAKHLVEAHVAEYVLGNSKAAGSESPGAASSTSRSLSGTSTPSDSGR